jgi:hypothetical protein
LPLTISRSISVRFPDLFQFPFPSHHGELEEITSKLQQEVTTIIAKLDAQAVVQVDFQKAVLAWMAKQDQKSQGASSSGSGPSLSEIFQSPKVNSGGDTLPSGSVGLPWAVKKIKLPEFSGFDPQGWIQKANLFFDTNATPEEYRLRLAQLSMIGVAQHWFTIIKQVRPSITWVEFQLELSQRFSGCKILMNN